MNQAQIGSLVRQIILIATGAFGLNTAANEQWIGLAITVVVALATGLWAIWTRTDKQLVVSAATKVDVPAASQHDVGINKVVTPQ